MRIRYREAGGFAALRRGVDLDTADLPPAAGRELERLVARLSPAARPCEAASAARDLVTYEITIERKDDSCVLTYDDETLPESAVALVTFLQARARPLPW